jgi:two-component system, LytTR family, sensor kinase
VTRLQPALHAFEDDIVLTGVSMSDGEAAPGLRPRSRKLFWVLTVACIVLFWIGQWSEITLWRYFSNPDEGTSYLLPRAIVSTIACFLSLAILAALWRLRRRSFRVRTLAALAFAFAGSTLHSLTNQVVFSLTMDDFWKSFAITDGAIGILNFLWYYVAASAMLLALTYAVDVGDREERINALRGLAQAAQLRALRNQLNPHFLFNTLNSIASLISRDRRTEAETMTESLADFLRHTLALDPQQPIPLGREIELQSLYLAIEKARFPDRLKVRLDIPADLEDALVPSLITQPLVENSIKYAVARSSDVVELEVVASARDDRLELIVRDNGGNADAAPIKGGQIGLTNVSDRLRVHYGDAAQLDAGPRPEGGFCNRLSLPLRHAP